MFEFNELISNWSFGEKFLDCDPSRNKS
ncbi:hypothetical protein THOG11_30079 [Vibrio harveyi]|nr:hypothetical protein TH15OA1_400053 [Vibrio harveyi]CAH1543279.1 hypothetical protein VHARVF571_550002 [Vibrio harveyi]CAH1553446.1 hypothetical protein THOD03_180079 [Vibrio harveyi]CAH1570585.1 hypothetical protein THOG11_30079 [Vibrio harveyi]